MESPSKINSSIPINNFTPETCKSKSPPPPGTKRQARTLQKFDEIFTGESGQRFQAFIRRFEAYCEAQGIQNQKADYFSCVLDGEAFELYNCFPIKTKASFNAAKEAMTKIYGPIRRQQGQEYTGLFSIKMEKNKSVKDHYMKVIRRLQESENYPAELSLEVFVSGLPKYIKDYLKLEKPKNLEEALAMAKSREATGISKNDPDVQIQEMKNALDNLIISQGLSEE